MPNDASVADVMPGKFAGTKRPAAGSFVVSNPRFTDGTTLALFCTLSVCVKLPPNAKLCLPCSQLKSSLMFRLGVLRGCVLVFVVSLVMSGVPIEMFEGAPGGVWSANMSALTFVKNWFGEVCQPPSRVFTIERPSVDRRVMDPNVRHEFCVEKFGRPGNRTSWLLSRSGLLLNRWNQYEPLRRSPFDRSTSTLVVGEICRLAEVGCQL